MAMGNNPMMYIDADGRTWGIFKAIGQAWDYAWGKGNQAAQWLDKVGVPSFNVGVGMNSGGQVNPMVNGQPVNSGYFDPGVSASVSIDQQRSQYSSPTHTGVTGGAVYTSPAISVGPLIFNGAWSYYPGEGTFNYSLAQVTLRTWWEQSSGRVEITDSPIDYLVGAGIGKSIGITIEKGFARATARGVSRVAAKSITTVDGFLFKGFTVKAPFNVPVQRFGNMSLTRPDFWGARIGTSKFTNRTFAAIKPSWNPLTQYTKGVITKGTPMKFGIVGPQGWKYPGGSFQFIIDSRNVINQSSKLIPQ